MLDGDISCYCFSYLDASSMLHLRNTNFRDIMLMIFLCCITHDDYIFFPFGLWQPFPCFSHNLLECCQVTPYVASLMLGDYYLICVKRNNGFMLEHENAPIVLSHKIGDFDILHMKHTRLPSFTICMMTITAMAYAMHTPFIH